MRIPGIDITDDGSQFTIDVLIVMGVASGILPHWCPRRFLAGVALSQIGEFLRIGFPSDQSRKDRPPALAEHVREDAVDLPRFTGRVEDLSVTQCGVMGETPVRRAPDPH